jgi:hypothetical protein
MIPLIMFASALVRRSRIAAQYSNVRVTWLESRMIVHAQVAGGLGCEHEPGLPMAAPAAIVVFFFALLPAAVAVRSELRRDHCDRYKHD